MSVLFETGELNVEPKACESRPTNKAQQAAQATALPFYDADRCNPSTRYSILLYCTDMSIQQPIK